MPRTEMDSSNRILPVELIFNPNWWYQNYGIAFDEAFYFDLDARIENDRLMRRVMRERFGLGETDPQPRPIVGSMYVAGGFVMPALFGVDIRFSKNEAPWPVALDADDQAIFNLKVPDIQTTWPMASWIADMDVLSDKWGHVVGDFDTDGILNTALQIRGQRLFLDFVDNPKLVHHLFSVVAETCVAVVSYVKSRTGTCAIATNRSILNVDRRIYLHSNCSVQMISPEVYRAYLLPYEKYLAERLQPYGIHHCGKNLDRFAEVYSLIPLMFLDVGWGSKVAACRKAFPDAFLNLRLSPVRLLQQSAENIREDVEQLLHAAGPLDRTGLCCINMDHHTPDENINVVLTVANHWGKN
jgi:uroporphyrinogen-III decarboxylase